MRPTTRDARHDAPMTPDTTRQLPLLPPDFAHLTPHPTDWLTVLYGGPALARDPLKEHR